MISTSSIVDVIGSLEKNVTALKNYVNDADNQKVIDRTSSHTYFGLPESVVETIESVNDALIIAVARLTQIGG